MATMVSLSLLLLAIILVAVPRSASAADMIEPPKVDELAIPRQQRFDLSKFGGKGDGVTLNTDAFTAAVAAIKAAGGGELYVGKGVWMTTGFALTSHMSLFRRTARRCSARRRTTRAGGHATSPAAATRRSTPRRAAAVRRTPRTVAPALTSGTRDTSPSLAAGT